MSSDSYWNPPPRMDRCPDWREVWGRVSRPCMASLDSARYSHADQCRYPSHLVHIIDLEVYRICLFFFLFFLFVFQQYSSFVLKFVDFWCERMSVCVHIGSEVFYENTFSD